jgi:hypothetical protein
MTLSIKDETITLVPLYFKTESAFYEMKCLLLLEAE